jgi:hypothetical protein
MGRGRAGISIMLLGSLLGGCSGANVYDMSPDQAYAKLILLEHGTPAVIEVEGDREAIYGTPGKSVTWVTDTAHSYYECTAYLTPEGSARTSVNVGCSDKNASAMLQATKAIGAAAAESGMPVFGGLDGVRHRYIELVDSTLDGRPFDQVRAKAKVMGWPDPPA